MRLLRNIVLLFVLMAGIARANTCPSQITAVNQSISCWSPPSSGTNISDAIDSNPITIAAGSTYSLPSVSAPYSNNALACGTASSSQPQNINGGCNLTTTQSYSPSAVTLIMSFSGNDGPLAQFASTSSVSAPFEYYELYVDAFGKLTWGVQNYGALNIIQSGQDKNFADGNQHIVVASFGANGMRLYADGSLLASNAIALGNYATGFWLFGNANLASAGGSAWPYAPAQGWFNGTLYYWAWGQSQISDVQAEALSNMGGNPPGNISNNYVNLQGQIASYAISQGLAYASQPVTFHSETSQLPACNSTIPIAPSSQTYYTDAQGNLPTNVMLQQGAHLTMTIGSSSQPLVMPCQSTITLAQLLPAQNPLPDSVSSVVLQGPLYQGTTVSNPGIGTVGPATLTAPGTIPNACSGGTVTINRALGPQQNCTMSAPTTIAFSNSSDGFPSLLLDVIADGVSTDVPTFPNTVVWPGGIQPTPNTATGIHNFYSFIDENGTLYGSLQALNSGTFPLTATADFNNFNGINVGGLSFIKQGPPSNLTATATCTGTCATTYTYDVTCVTNSGESNPAIITGTNASTLSVTNNNALTWSAQPQCSGGFNIYGRTPPVGLLTNVSPSTNSFTDNGSIPNPVNNYTFNFNTSGYPAVVIWDLKNAATSAPIDASAAASGNSTIITMPKITTTQTNDTQLAIYATDRNTGLLTGVTGFISNVTISPSTTSNFGLAIFQKNINTATTIASNTNGRTAVSGSYGTINAAIEAANPAVPITIGNSINQIGTAPYTSITVTDPPGAATGDLEIACVSFGQGSGITQPPPPAGFNLFASALGVAPFNQSATGHVQVNCYWLVPTVTGTPPPLLTLPGGTTGGLSQVLANGQVYNDFLFGLIGVQGDTGNLPNGAAVSAPMFSISYPVPMTVQSCRTSWVGYTGCSTFPNFALKDITAGNPLCQSGFVTTSNVDGPVPIMSAALPANDVLAFLATTNGISCTGGHTSINAVLHQ